MVTNIVVPFPAWKATCVISRLCRFLQNEVKGINLDFITPRRYTLKEIKALYGDRTVIEVGLWSPGGVYAKVKIVNQPSLPQGERLKITKIKLQWEKTFGPDQGIVILALEDDELKNFLTLVETRNLSIGEIDDSMVGMGLNFFVIKLQKISRMKDFDDADATCSEISYHGLKLSVKEKKTPRVVRG